MSDSEIGKRVKRNLRVQDQTDNMKRILNQQKQYKMLLVQDMLIKEKKMKEFTDFRKSVALASNAQMSSSMRNNANNFGGPTTSKSLQNITSAGITI
jgi:hypothetical protein